MSNDLPDNRRKRAPRKSTKPQAAEPTNESFPTDQEQWTCQCSYTNTGPICTHCGNPRSTVQTGSGSFPSAQTTAQQPTHSNEGTEQPVTDTPAKPADTPPMVGQEGQKNPGDIRISAESTGFDAEIAAKLASLPREAYPGEKKHEYWERMRKLARANGLPRGQTAGSAYAWADIQAELAFPRVIPAPVPAQAAVDPPEEIVEATEEIKDSKPSAPTAAKAEEIGVAGLGEIPRDWPPLPANASLQVEIAWVTANRLRVRAGSGVDLSRALSPAPSYSALSWLETSILFPGKFADISVKATADHDDEKEEIRREKLAIEEIRSILKEMLDASKTQ